MPLANAGEEGGVRMSNHPPLIEYLLRCLLRLLKCISALTPEINLLRQVLFIIPIAEHKEAQ